MTLFPVYIWHLGVPLVGEKTNDFLLTQTETGLRFCSNASVARKLLQRPASLSRSTCSHVGLSLNMRISATVVALLPRRLGVVDVAVGGGRVDVVCQLAALEAHALVHQTTDPRAHDIEARPRTPSRPLGAHRADPP
eukprot:CAMPEP_0174924460 /NCGR_PEP_ID=MMETSP1355-20121228/7266_1 /TAXON_ID=464990 /ORGANISM="Hemiselmis tepida, Strain CCMP443" /LENGTH=136 /DNA_ID=CAMNT_0016170269 /DNA_START=27 /DNA_END=433 /DNA_ORIENTATION=+